MVKTGDSIPNVDLVEGSPSDKVNLSKELASGKGLIVGIPAAFSEYLPPPPKNTKAHRLLMSDVGLRGLHQALLARLLISLAMSVMTSSRMPAKSL